MSPLNASDIWVLKAITRGLTIRAGVSKFPRNDDEEKKGFRPQRVIGKVQNGVL